MHVLLLHALIPSLHIYTDMDCKTGLFGLINMYAQIKDIHD